MAPPGSPWLLLAPGSSWLLQEEPGGARGIPWDPAESFLGLSGHIGISDLEPRLILHAGQNMRATLSIFQASKQVRAGHCQEEPGGARGIQEEPGGARRSEEKPGGAKRSQEEPGQEEPGARRSQERPGSPLWPQFHVPFFLAPPGFPCLLVPPPLKHDQGASGRS